jgi:hypothetical protein
MPRKRAVSPSGASRAAGSESRTERAAWSRSSASPPATADGGTRIVSVTASQPRDGSRAISSAWRTSDAGGGAVARRGPGRPVPRRGQAGRRRDERRARAPHVPPPRPASAARAATAAAPRERRPARRPTSPRRAAPQVGGEGQLLAVAHDPADDRVPPALLRHEAVRGLLVGDRHAVERDELVPDPQAGRPRRGVLADPDDAEALAALLLRGRDPEARVERVGRGGRPQTKSA